MRIVFAGTPEFAATHLSALISSDHDVIAVYTQPDRPAGRGKKLTPSAVKTLAQENGIEVYQPLNFKHQDDLATLSSLEADLMIVVAYGIILPRAVLDAPKFGCINVHGSILPKWRGAAPIQRALWAGDETTGITIMQMDEGLDTGDILSISTCAIETCDTSASLYEKLAELGPRTLVDTLNSLPSVQAIKQDDTQATYAKKLSKQEAQIDWQLSAEQINRNVRAFNPWPVAWFSVEGYNVKVWNADISTLPANHDYQAGEIIAYDTHGLHIACATGSVIITKLQLPNKKAQFIDQLVNGQPHLFQVGAILG